MLSNESLRNKRSVKQLKTYKFKPLNNQILNHNKIKTKDLILKLENKAQINAINNVQRDSNSQNEASNKSFQQTSDITRNRISDTPYFGQKRINILNVDPRDDVSIEYQNSKTNTLDQDNLNQQKWSSYKNNKAVDSDEEKYNEESFYDTQSESETERLKQSSTTKAYSSFKSTLKCSIN